MLSTDALRCREVFIVPPSGKEIALYQNVVPYHGDITVTVCHRQGATCHVSETYYSTYAVIAELGLGVSIRTPELSICPLLPPEALSSENMETTVNFI